MSVLNTGLATPASGYDIPNSLRFNDDDSAYLSWTPSSAGNQKTWTFSAWTKLDYFTSGQHALFSARSTSTDQFTIWHQSNKFVMESGGGKGNISINALTRDSSAWYHLMFVLDASNGTASERARIYINGVRQDVTTSTSFSDADHGVNSAIAHNISAEASTNSNFYGGYLAEVNFIDGFAKDHTHFGETDETYGHWKAKEYTHSDGYGTNGFYLDFKLSADSASGLGNDASSNSNNWTPNNLDTYDQMLDSSTNNFSTLNPLKQKDVTLSEGNLKSFGGTGGSGDVLTHSTFGVSSGKWYAEFAYTAISGTSSPEAAYAVGIQKTESTGSTDLSYRYYAYWGTKYKDSDEPETYGVAYTAGDIIGIAFDAENGAVYFSKNGAWQSSATATEIANGTTTNAAFTGISGEYNFYGTRMGGTEHTGVWNFGQDSTFAGNETGSAGPYTDDNNTGLGDFYYTPPSGFLALCTKNLADPAAGLWSGGDNQAFNTVLYTGDGDPRTISGVGFQPDWVWTKPRNNSGSHVLVDAVRGNTKLLETNSTGIEQTTSSGITGFNGDGYTLGTGNDWNVSGDTFVSWNWKAGNETLGTGAFTQGTIPSTCSRNADAGFSIVSYEGTGSSNSTVGHGLSSVPEMIITKNRDSATAGENWNTYHSAIGETKYLRLNTTGEASTYAMWADTAPTTSVFSIRENDSHTNVDDDNYIAYCFHSVDGYSKVGSYTGNASTDGTFVYTGFRPAYVMIKSADAAEAWYLFDTARSIPESF